MQTYCQDHLANADKPRAYIQQNSPYAFEHLYDSYAATLYGVIVKIVSCPVIASDLLQETFVKIWRRLDSYDAGKGALYTWMHAIARNIAIDHIRSKENRTAGLTVHNHTQRGELNTGHELNVNKIGLANLVNKLPCKYEQVIQLFYYNGFTINEASRLLAPPTGTIKTRLRKAILMLRASFEFAN